MNVEPAEPLTLTNCQEASLFAGIEGSTGVSWGSPGSLPEGSLGIPLGFYGFFPE